MGKGRMDTEDTNTEKQTKNETFEENDDFQQKRPGFFSHLILHWITATMRVGKQRALVIEDLHPVVWQMPTNELNENLQSLWDKELEKCKKAGENPRLWKVVLQSISFKMYIFLITSKLIEYSCQLLQAVCLSLLLTKAMERDNQPGPDTGKMVCLYVVGLCFASLVQILFSAHRNYLSCLTGSHVKAAVSGLVYHKVLNLSESSLAEMTSGRVVNMIARDVQPFPFAAGALVYIVTAPYVVLVVSLTMWQLVGVPALTGIAFMVMCIVIYLEIGNDFMVMLCEKASRFTDRRLSLVNDVICGIRILKMNAWEWLFRDLIGEQRRKEIQVYMWKSIMLSVMYGFPYQLVATLISLMFLLLEDYKLTPQNIFTTAALLNVLGRVFYTNFVYGVDFGSRSWDALNRIEEFLLIGLENDSFPEQGQSDTKDEGVKEVNYVSHDGKLWAKSSFYRSSQFSPKTIQPFAADLPSIHLDIRDLSIEQGGNPGFLRGISIVLQASHFVAITGPIGCGKSSLLYAILGELPITSGHISGWGVIAYVPQKPWIFSGTVRDNILFGRRYLKQWYDKVVEACALRKDFDLLPAGDLTHIGERGASLSGGQRARVSLARAVYGDTDIYLFDDPLSAVDPQVSRQIFEQCIMGVLSQRIRILVTHNTKQLKDADQVLVLGGATVSNQGTYTELLQSSQYIKFLESREKNEESKVEGVTGSDEQKRRYQVTRLLSEKSNGLKVSDEERSTGKVALKTYGKFIRTGIQPALLVGLAFLLVLPDVASIFTDLFLTQMRELSLAQQRSSRTLLLYGGLATTAVVLAICRGVALFNALLRCSEKLHNNMLIAILKTSLQFFDTNPAGRVLNRFSKDVNNIDELLPLYLTGALQYFSFCIGTFVLVSIVNLWVCFAVVATLPVMLYIGWFYLRSSREMKRVECITASPICSHLADTIEGIVSIRAYEKERDFMNMFYRLQDINNTAWLSFTTSIVWVSFVLDALVFVLLVGVTVASILAGSNAAMIGLSITYAFQVLGAASQTAIQGGEAENFMTSVERVLSYGELEPEEGYYNEQTPDLGWPWRGIVHFQNTSLTYYPGGPKTLKRVTVKIDEGEKIGIVGRTGAGKSSLIAALFRMVEYEGLIVVDSVSLQAINLQACRLAFAVVPQNPFLFSASLRRNLDPFDRHSDLEIWQVLEDVQISTVVRAMPDTIHSQVIEGGSNFSIGERQLLCLARALLLRKKIVILDEATANVDLYTDQVIQSVIRDQLYNCTVLTIAHRLDTVLDYDKILVLDNGEVSEFGTPDELKKNEQGLFSHFLREYNLKGSGRV